MQLFVDESGDPGGNKSAGASSCYIVATLVVATYDDQLQIEETLRSTRQSLRVPASSEFRWSRNSTRIREAVVAALDPNLFRWRYCLCMKDLPYQSPAELLGATIAQRLEFPPPIIGATLNIDGESTPHGLAKICRQLLANNGPDDPRTLSKVRFLDSKRTPCLQVADYLAGMSGRWHRKNVPIDPRWLISLDGNAVN
jgi:hypothetical protein